MAANNQGQVRQQPQQIFVKADELDAGTSILTPSRDLPLSALNPTDASQPATSRPKAPARPVLQREASTPPPPPPAQPPPAPPPGQPDVTDSLSLPQLKELVKQFPKPEPKAYAFQYKDADDYEPEIDEWFHYTELDQDRDYLLVSLEAFEQRWKLFSVDLPGEITYTASTVDQRSQFLADLIDDLGDECRETRVEALCCVYYVLCGVWSTTCGLENSSIDKEEDNDTERPNVTQVEWMHRGVDSIASGDAISQLYSCLVRATKGPTTNHHSQAARSDDTSEPIFDENDYRELSLCLSCFYLLMESARVRIGKQAGLAIRDNILALQPNFLVLLVDTISRLRWNDSYNLPIMHALQLFWKSTIVLFGDVTEHLEKIKSIVQPRVAPFSAEAANPVLTTSPLAYHLFRQEITSKYPAYNPPLPIIPLDIEDKTMLPPLPNQSRPDTYVTSQVSSSALPQGSIFHHPVHIATPAPSPPPSPIGPGGKTGKKQNYQTNQNLPFLYPPLDSSSNDIGGKGSTELQDMMVGKQWEGADVPLSIIEAGELFSSRSRMSRAMRQLWQERQLFLEYERGWKGSIGDVSGLDKDKTKLNEEEKELARPENSALQSRLDAVEEFFHQALPNLQSLIIVMMKVMLANVQDIAVRNGGLQDPAQGAGLNRTKSNLNMAQTQSLPMPPPPPRPADMTLEDLDNVRSREISQKAISGTIFLLLKWFKVSHVLKFEYLTQLLLDSNYVQLTLKYFAHQNLEDLVAFKYDRDDLSFWHYCHVHSDHPPLSPTSPDERSANSSGDEAAPPPITRNQPSSRADVSSPATQTATQRPAAEVDVEARPSVDELGNPLGPIPTTPITTYSFRQFQTSIHLLRNLQKLTRGKSHRILFLVQFKSSQILRRVLRVPDTTLRLYVLKLFKSQVPYCGRKWRQSNMRVITAIYLHCRPELRDEWLAGMHDASIEGEVDEAVPLEWALRGLTFWWQKRMYPDVVRRKGISQSRKRPPLPKIPSDAGDNDDVDLSELDQLTLDDHDDDDEQDVLEGGQEIDDDERDFFQRELEAIGWGLSRIRIGDGSEDVAFGEEAMTQMPMSTNGTSVNGASDMNMGDSMTGSAPAPQWVVPDAASLEAWQNDGQFDDELATQGIDDEVGRLEALEADEREWEIRRMHSRIRELQAVIARNTGQDDTDEDEVEDDDDADEEDWDDSVFDEWIGDLDETENGPGQYGQCEVDYNYEYDFSSTTHTVGHIETQAESGGRRTPTPE